MLFRVLVETVQIQELTYDVQPSLLALETRANEAVIAKCVFYFIVLLTIVEAILYFHVHTFS